MKELTVVGIGMSARTLTREAVDAIASAEALFGARRMLAEVAEINVAAPVHESYDPQEILEFIEAESAGRSRFVLMVSGDTGFYSAAHSIAAEAGRRGAQVQGDVEIRFVPGISSVSYFCAKCKLPWQEMKLISCHGREGGVVDAVRRNRFTFALTGKNTREIAEALCVCGFGDLRVYVGENLSAETERVRTVVVRDLRETETSSLTVLIVENEHPDRRGRVGIADEEFIRGEVPMTKSEVRALILSKLEISPGDCCLDIGCGTGSVSVEMALAAYEGAVYSFDVSEEAVRLTMDNARRFQIGNLRAKVGRAPGCLASFEEGRPKERSAFAGEGGEGASDRESNRESDVGTEAFAEYRCPDAAFIGGTKGGMEEIVRMLNRINPKMRICITAIALETALEAVRALEHAGREAEIVQMQSARAKKVGGLHMMMGQNPIYVISSK